MNILRYNEHVEELEALIVSKSIEGLKGGNWSVYNGFDVVEKVRIFDVVPFDVPESLYQVLGLAFVDALVITECECGNCSIPQTVI